MKKIAFLNRSIYMMEAIAEELKRLGYQTYLLSHCRIKVNKRCFDEIVYLPSRVKYANPYNITDSELLNCGILQFEYQRKVKKRGIKKSQLLLIKKHMSIIKDYLISHKIDTVVIYNGSTIVERITQIIANEIGLRTVFIEEGFFRPFTISVDTKGVNALNSVPRNKEFYGQLEINNELYEKYLLKPISVRAENRKFESLARKIWIKSTYGMFNKVCELMGRQIKTDYMVTMGYIIKKLSYPLSDKSRKRSLVLELPEKYIFAPLQVHYDSQILLHAPMILNMEMFIQILAHAVAEFNKQNNENYALVIKQHPLDHINYRNIGISVENCSMIVIDDYSTEKLIENASLVVTINSTVAIEALIRGKKVISLGDAFYNIEGIVTHCEHLSVLADTVKRVLISRNDDSELIRKFLYYLRFCYNVEGFLNTKDRDTCMNIARKIVALTEDKTIEKEEGEN